MCYCLRLHFHFFPSLSRQICSAALAEKECDRLRETGKSQERLSQPSSPFSRVVCLCRRRRRRLTMEFYLQCNHRRLLFVLLLLGCLRGSLSCLLLLLLLSLSLNYSELNPSWELGCSSTSEGERRFGRRSFFRTDRRADGRAYFKVRARSYRIPVPI